MTLHNDTLPADIDFSSPKIIEAPYVAMRGAMLLQFGSGNRDAQKFADPDRFDVTRTNAHRDDR